MDGRTDLTEITPLDNSLDNSTYKMTDYAKFGLASSIGGSIFGAAAIMGSMGTPYFLSYPAIVSSFFSTITSGGGLFTADRTHYKISDYVKWGVATGFAIGASTAVMVGGAAVPVIANITVTPLSDLAIIATPTGTAIANVIITPAATALLGFGLFKAQKHLQAKNVENDYAEERRLSV